MTQELFLLSLWWNKIAHGLVYLPEYSAHESAFMCCYAPRAGAVRCAYQSVQDCTRPGHRCSSPPMPDHNLLTPGNCFLAQGAATVQDLHPQLCFRISHREHMGGRESLDLGSADLDSRGSFVTNNLSSHCSLTCKVMNNTHPTYLMWLLWRIKTHFVNNKALWWGIEAELRQGHVLLDSYCGCGNGEKLCLVHILVLLHVCLFVDWLLSLTFCPSHSLVPRQEILNNKWSLVSCHLSPFVWS